MTDILNNFSEKIAEQMDIEIARGFLVHGVKMLSDDGIMIEVDQESVSSHVADGKWIYETSVGFSRLDTSRHDSDLIDVVFKELVARGVLTPHESMDLSAKIKESIKEKTDENTKN